MTMLMGWDNCSTERRQKYKLRQGTIDMRMWVGCSRMGPVFFSMGS
jgi:hypothetical protein